MPRVKGKGRLTEEIEGPHVSHEGEGQPAEKIHGHRASCDGDGAIETMGTNAGKYRGCGL